MRFLRFLSLQKIAIILLMLCLLPQSAWAQSAELNNRLLNASLNTIEADSTLHSTMSSIAEQALDEHCVACHGDNLEGKVGVPNLVDYDWLWGVTGLEINSTEAVMKIMQTILYGVRDEDCLEETKQYGACPDTRFSQMPGYGILGYTDEQVSDLTEYLVGLNGGEADPEAVARAEPFWIICTECHGEDGYGYKPYGGPDLRDDVWLFGAGKSQIYDVIYNGRTESCPAWAEILEPLTVKALAVYLYSKSMGG